METIKKIWNIVAWVVVTVVLLLAIALAGVRFMGYTPFAILSPSMAPQYQVGDLVYVKSVNPEEIEVGDVLTFVANEDLVVVTHRVYEVDRENRRFITKGDANNIPDVMPVLYENALGVVHFAVPKLGYVSMYLSGETGKYIGIAVIASLLLLFLLPEILKKDEGKKEK